MHRSGTTMLAEAMHRSGVFMGVMRDHNGEAFHFLSLNQQMLWAANSDWLNPSVPNREADKSLPVYEIYAEHIKTASANPIKLKLFQNRPWGWKDPRNTFTLGLWLNQFPKAKVIHLVRDGRAVAQSLTERNKRGGEVHDNRLDDTAFCFGLWEKYVAQARSWKEKLGDDYLELRFEDLPVNDFSASSQLDRFVGKPVSTHIENRSQAEKKYSSKLQDLARQSEVFRALDYSV